MPMLKFWKKKFVKKLVDARNNLIDMHFIQSLKNKFCFDLSVSGYFYKQLLQQNDSINNFLLNIYFQVVHFQKDSVQNESRLTTPPIYPSWTVFIEILNLKSMLLSVGGHRVLERSPNIVPNSNLKIWNWYKLLTLWKVVLIDLYALLSNSLYTEHGSASLFFKIIFHKNFLFFSCLNFRFWQIYHVPEILCQCQWFMLG